MSNQHAGEAIAGAIAKGSIPAGLGIAHTFFGVPLDLWLKWLTMLWLVILIAGALWDRFFHTWATPLMKAQAVALWQRWRG